MDPMLDIAQSVMEMPDMSQGGLRIPFLLGNIQ
jgi:hypothetical protein